MTMGEKILNLRKARGWSQEELADRVGVTRQAVSRWESGSAKPDADKIIAICDLFGVSADYLLRVSYNGESGQAVHSEPRDTELGKFFRSLTLKQWGGIGLSVLGCLVLLGLRLIYLFSNTNYSYSDFYRDYYGFSAFLRCEEVLGIWYAGLATLAAGVILILWHKIKKWNILVAIHNWCLEYQGISPEE